MTRPPVITPDRCLRLPVESISYGIWPYCRFCLSDEVDLRRTISAATNIAEAWNGFVQWVACGSEGVIRQNNRGEQSKISRYNHVVADNEPRFDRLPQPMTEDLRLPLSHR